MQTYLVTSPCESILLSEPRPSNTRAASNFADLLGIMYQAIFSHLFFFLLIEPLFLWNLWILGQDVAPTPVF